MSTVAAPLHPITRLWEWLGWKSKAISSHRAHARAALSDAELRLATAQDKAKRSADMSEWLRQRSEENHIAESLNSILEHPRRWRW